jgi:murein DD-endopeptidase MepM/ murein hydrolase activator NlpD
MPVRLRPPRLEVLEGRSAVRQGGSGVAVLRIGETAIRSGVRAGDFDTRSYPMPDAPGDRRLVLFAVPWNLDGDLEIRAFAEDDAGNRAEVPFVTSLRRVEIRHDTIEVSDRFLERVVPAIVSQTPGFDASGSLLDQYLRINGEYRRSNLETMRRLADRSADRFLWSAPFLQLPRSARKAGFAETRSYTYRGRTVDRQTHLGLDLASTRNAPVPSAADGRVVYAGWLAIYGNVVVIDHGCGLMTAYGHLDAIDVVEGDSVLRGDHIGITGTTGLAGGDHLHFEVFVGGQSVNPMEWLDERWIRNMIVSRVPVAGM